ncbi:MAG TPA: prolyl-tRNA synthetase associated domain-containing protein [Bacteroidales bacterium]|nr:prolyl-tRNA synthetase associated domain-containing protein [Bacteroidales bacterium]
MQGQQELYEILEKLSIKYEYYEHPPISTIQIAKLYWNNLNSGRCKNIFFRNHKGNKHYLVILEHLRQLDIHDLERRLKQGKLTFASDKRLKHYLGLEPGSVSPFGLINDKEKNVHVFIDEKLKGFEKLAFHPNINTATLVVLKDDLIKFLEYESASYEFIRLYDE